MLNARVLVSLIGICLLSACATPHWVKPGASKADLAQDQSVCMRTMQEPPPQGSTNEQIYKDCMTAHGWTLQEGAAVAR